MKEIWPLMNADKRGSKTNRSSAFIRVHQRLKLVFLSALFVGVAVGQAVPVVTVCEALQNRDQYNGEQIVVVGRLRDFVGRWLREDCQQQVVADGKKWINAISLSYVVGTVEVPPLPKDFQWDHDLLDSKLKQAQKHTTSDPIKEGNYVARWIAVFGRFEAKQLRTGHGYGIQSDVPAQLISARDALLELRK